MTVFNLERFCAEAIGSILAQSLADLELLAIDDGSTDRTAAIVDRLAAGDRRIRAIHTPNRGICAARNLGLMLARSDLIACMDGDDVSLADRLERQVAFLGAHPEVGVVGGSMDIIDWRGALTRGGACETDIDAIRDSAIETNPIGYSTAMLRRSLALEAGGFRKVCTHAEDYDLWLRLGERTLLANLPEVLVRYRWHGGNASIRHSKGQRLAGTLAQISARHRRAGKPDPLDGLVAVDETVLDLPGLSAEERSRLAGLIEAAKAESRG